MNNSKEFAFEASHRLPRHPGKCQRLHGHSYLVVVHLRGATQQESGFVVDYGDIGAFVKPLIEQLDHRHLNCFIQYPSAENIATYIASKLEPFMKELGVYGWGVEVRETANTSAVWWSVNAEDIGRLHDPEANWRAPTLVIAGFEDHLEELAATEASRASHFFERSEQALTKSELIRLHLENVKHE